MTRDGASGTEHPAGAGTHDADVTALGAPAETHEVELVRAAARPWRRPGAGVDETRRVPVATTVNDLVLFAVELAAWAAFGVWGWHVGVGPWRWVLAIVLPLAVIGLWAVIAAPNSGNRLTDPALFAFQLGVFLAGAVLLVLAERPVWGGALGVVAVVVVVLDRALGSISPA